MGSNPINLAVRFILERAGLVALGWWGWNQGEGVLRFLFALGIPFLADEFNNRSRNKWGSEQKNISFPGLFQVVENFHNNPRFLL